MIFSRRTSNETCRRVLGPSLGPYVVECEFTEIEIDLYDEHTTAELEYVRIWSDDCNDDFIVTLDMLSRLSDVFKTRNIYLGHGQSCMNESPCKFEVWIEDIGSVE